MNLCEWDVQADKTVTNGQSPAQAQFSGWQHLPPSDYLHRSLYANNLAGHQEPIVSPSALFSLSSFVS